jgi:hypothetical protein
MPSHTFAREKAKGCGTGPVQIHTVRDLILNRLNRGAGERNRGGEERNVKDEGITNYHLDLAALAVRV